MGLEPEMWFGVVLWQIKEIFKNDVYVKRSVYIVSQELIGGRVEKKPRFFFSATNWRSHQSSGNPRKASLPKTK